MSERDKGFASRRHYPDMSARMLSHDWLRRRIAFLSSAFSVLDQAHTEVDKPIRNEYDAGLMHFSRAIECFKSVSWYYVNQEARELARKMKEDQE